MVVKRYLLILFLLVVGCLCMSSAVVADDYPSKSIELIVPWSVGGGSDIIMRTLAPYLEQELGVTVIVVNKPGAGGAVGASDLARSNPDGYTIGMASNSLVKTAYSGDLPTPLEDYETFGYIGMDSSALTVSASSPWEDIHAFIEEAKQNPGFLTNANDTPGGGSHIAVLTLEEAAGIELNKIPYPGFAESVAALAGNHVDSTSVPVADVLQQHEEGTFRILGVMGHDRHFLAPDVPTFKEQGYDVVSGVWRAMFVPAGTPIERIEVLEEALLNALTNPDLVERLQGAGFDVSPQGRAWAEQFIAEEDELLYAFLEELDLVDHPKE